MPDRALFRAIACNQHFGVLCDCGPAKALCGPEENRMLPCVSGDMSNIYGIRACVCRMIKREHYVDLAEFLVNHVHGQLRRSMYRIVTYADYKAVSVRPERCPYTCFTFTRDIPPVVQLKCAVTKCKLVDPLELSEWLYNHMFTEKRKGSWACLQP